MGAAWRELLGRALGSAGEPLIRAVRDNFADALQTLPFQLAHFRPAALHFYMSTLTPLRRALQPALCGAYDSWRETRATQPLERVIRRGAAHWKSVAEHLVSDRSLPGDSETFIETHAL